jgi:hypothetical protein
MWPFSKNKKEEEDSSSVFVTDAILSRALMGNRDAWGKILNSGVTMSCTIIHRWGDTLEKEDCFNTNKFIDFVIGQHANKSTLPEINDDDKLWEITQEIVKSCIDFMKGKNQIPAEISKYIEDANNAPAIHEGALLMAMMNPVSNLTKKAQDITKRLS